MGRPLGAGRLVLASLVAVATALGGASCGPDGDYSQCGVSGARCCGSGPPCRGGLTCVDHSCIGILTDAAPDTGHLDAAACKAHTTRCVGNGVETCSSSGAWGAAVACVDQVCISGSCQGECAPGQTTCSGSGVQTCDSTGHLGAAAACTTGQCAAGACSGSTARAPSCQGGLAGQATCGKGGTGSESCCTSGEVPGGAFNRGYDGVSPGATSTAWPATVSGYRLDRYKVTVGRFRAFVAASAAGWAPAAGDGVHSHLAGGAGLADPAGGNELGWDGSWNAMLPSTAADWTTALGCDASLATWTPAAGGAEDLPINCVSWYDAYAFCIWDGGFLPSEAEANYAEAGGGGADGQRVYPWSTPSTETTADCTYANFAAPAGGCGAGASLVGAQSPKGDGRWGQADLVGDLWEWTLDYVTVGSTYPSPCADCANSQGAGGATLRVRRGGAFYETAGSIIASVRGSAAPASRSNATGVRCARVP